jgi:hypothetical protein
MVIKNPAYELGFLLNRDAGFRVFFARQDAAHAAAAQPMSKIP